MISKIFLFDFLMRVLAHTVQVIGLKFLNHFSARGLELDLFLFIKDGFF